MFFKITKQFFVVVMRAIASSSSLDSITILLMLEWLFESRDYDKLQMGGPYEL